MAAPGPAIGERIGDYRILSKLGEGGMGVVYLAEDVRLGRKVALKALAREYAGDAERRRRFLNEARAAAALSHPAVAAVYELEERGDDVFIIFEYVEGRTLRAMVQAGAPRLPELLEIALQVAQALEAAHARGIVHRDLKPENVMLRRGPGDTLEAKVLDFGLARFDSGILAGSTTQSFGMTQAGTVMGTVGYMSPEQLEGRPADFRSDLFSFGVLLYELAAGAHPFAGETPASTIANIMTQEPPPLTAANALHPPELERIVRKCLRKPREERYQSTHELVVDLKNLKRDSGESRIVTAPVAVTRSSRKQAVLAVIQAMFALPYALASWLLGQIILFIAADPTVSSRDRLILGGGLALGAGGFLGAAATAVEFARGQQASFRRFSRWFPAFFVLNATSACLMLALAARWDLVLAGVLVLVPAGVWAIFYQKRLAQELAPPQAGPAAARFDFRSPQTWWLLHTWSNLLVLVPWVGYWGWLTRGYFGTVSKLVLLAQVLLLGMEWSLRFVLLCMWAWKRGALAATWQRLTPPLRWAGFGIIATMLVQAGTAVAKDDLGFGALIGGLAMGGLVSVLFIEPAIEPPTE